MYRGVWTEDLKTKRRTGFLEDEAWADLKKGKTIKRIVSYLDGDHGFDTAEIKDNEEGSDVGRIKDTEMNDFPFNKGDIINIKVDVKEVKEGMPIEFEVKLVVKENEKGNNIK